MPSQRVKDILDGIFDLVSTKYYITDKGRKVTAPIFAWSPFAEKYVAVIVQKYPQGATKEDIRDSYNTMAPLIDTLGNGYFAAIQAALHKGYITRKSY